MDIKDLRLQLGDTQSEFSSRYEIPFRTIQNWEAGIRKPPKYIKSLLEQRVYADLMNRKTIDLPKHDAKKLDLPKRSDYVGSFSWLKAVQKCLGSNFVFALDEALMCHEYFSGRNDEYIVWVYGDDSLTKYNGVVVLGNYISSLNVKVKKGLKYTDFNRTISDSLANKSILDMQGITEAIARYYYSNDEKFDGIFVAPEYQKSFEKLAEEAISYYEN